MTQWYYVQDGRQAGPVDDATFRQWIAEGRVSREQLIWCEGMAQWQAAGTVPGLFAASVPPPIAYEAVADRLAEPPTDGSGGQAGVGNILGNAFRMMGRKFPLLLGAVVLVILVNSVPDILQKVASPRPGEPAAVLLSFFNLVWAICIVLPMTLGASAFSLRVICGQPTGMDAVFSGFRMFGKAIGLQLWMGLLVLLWSLLLIVPGIIAALRYSQAIYLITYRPNLGIKQAVQLSGDMMRGHKARLFGLGLLIFLIALIVFLPVWVILAFVINAGIDLNDPSHSQFALLLWLLFGVLSIPVSMLQWLAMADFHRDLTPPAIPAA
ncbi:MAG: DUF975 family protein [Phycisphaerae bacterium]|nr:DUF975 family protein [Phycisphaerae bacterium]